MKFKTAVLSLEIAAIFLVAFLAFVDHELTPKAVPVVPAQTVIEQSQKTNVSVPQDKKFTCPTACKG